ncbi:hypothetical protein [Ascidiimonas aurantiaca]|uniref:hypothetical protein n=1 Tax=Ascidiimonas aurantiaca TaxID=1685432 RepID=UPI0030EDEB94
MKKISIKNIGTSIPKNEMRKISGGRQIGLAPENADSDCAEGSFKCTCNGKDFGCVTSISECWNKC